MEPAWLQWAKKLQAIAQNGLTYSQNPFEIERYEAIRQIASQMMAAGTGTPAQKIADLFAGQFGYATPKVDVRGVVFREGKILLVKDRLAGCWTLPGGWADVGESPSRNVEREVREESGFVTKAVRLLAVYDRRQHQTLPATAVDIYKLFFLCELIGGRARTSHETEQVGFFAEDEISALTIGKVTPQQIMRMFELARKPDIPADFD